MQHSNPQIPLKKDKASLNTKFFWPQFHLKTIS